MAIFKPFRGNSAGLNAVEKHDGYAYFCTDSGEFFIDYSDADGELHRKQLNANDAKTLLGATLVNELTNNELEIPTGAAVMEALDGYAAKALIVTVTDGKASHTSTEIAEHAMAGGSVSFAYNSSVLVPLAIYDGTRATFVWSALSYDDDSGQIPVLQSIICDVDADGSATVNTPSEFLVTSVDGQTGQVQTESEVMVVTDIGDGIASHSGTEIMSHIKNGGVAVYWAGDYTIGNMAQLVAAGDDGNSALFALNMTNHLDSDSLTAVTHQAHRS